MTKMNGFPSLDLDELDVVQGGFGNPRVETEEPPPEPEPDPGPMRETQPVPAWWPNGSRY